MNVPQVEAQITAIDTNLTKTQKLLAKARRTEAKAKTANERAALELTQVEQELGQLQQELIYEFTEADEWDSSAKDPRTGERTQDWGDMVLERLLRSDPRFADALGKLYQSQGTAIDAKGIAMEAQAATANLYDKLSIQRANASLVSSLLRFAATTADDGDES
ncbi:hypothetical protein LCGC14_2828190 [marine sediment metagenome]|uniref:Uncharacterized protein n=1 Tax=marine sediment metagenome TaxID=412755 RepID=A0A0F8YEW8_9ZZZZ